MLFRSVTDSFVFSFNAKVCKDVLAKIRLELLLLTGLTEGQRRLRHSDCSATQQSESDRQPGLAKGAIGSSAPPDPGLGLGLSPGRR